MAEPKLVKVRRISDGKEADAHPEMVDDFLMNGWERVPEAKPKPAPKK